MYKLEEVFHRHELQNIIIGNESVKFGEVIQAITGFLEEKKKQYLQLKEISTAKRKKQRI